MRLLTAGLFLSAALYGVSPQTQEAARIVIAALQGRTPTSHLSPYLLEVFRNGTTLPEDQQAVLRAYGYDFSGQVARRAGGDREEAKGLDQYLDQDIFRIHYTTTGTHAVAPDDGDQNGIPDYIDSLAQVFQTVYTLEITTMGFVRPPGDGDEHYDVYVRKLQHDYYGYTMPEELAQGTGDNEFSPVKETNALTSYLALRNSYAGFPNTETENLQVTAAHEFFHAIQYGHDGWEEIWLLEATAVWMEDAVFDAVNDCYQYLPEWFHQPQRSLESTASLHEYGSFIFFQYISEHLGGWTVIRKTFENSVFYDSHENDYSQEVVDLALKRGGSSLPEALSDMVIANLILSADSRAGSYRYEEAEGYLAYFQAYSRQHPQKALDGPAIYRTVSFQAPDSLSSGLLEGYASQYVRLLSSDPVQVDLVNRSGPPTDLGLHAILGESGGNYTILSGLSLNVDPAGWENIHLAVVSQDTVGGSWDYTLHFKPGRPQDEIAAEEFKVSVAYPNPFNTRTQFSIQVFRAGRIRVDVVALDGRRVATLWKGEMSTGSQAFRWDGRSAAGKRVPSGVYFLVVKGATKQRWQKITLVK